MQPKLVIPEVFIGSKIQAVFDSRNIKLSDFADELGTVRQNVYRIFKKQDLDTGLLTKVSEVLNHNFFQYYNTEQTGGQDDKTVADLKDQLSLARQEIDYLKRIIHLMDEKARLLSLMEDTSEEEKNKKGQKEDSITDRSVSFS